MAASGVVVCSGSGGFVGVVVGSGVTASGVVVASGVTASGVVVASGVIASGVVVGGTNGVQCGP